MSGHDQTGIPVEKILITADSELADLIPDYLDSCREYCREIKMLQLNSDFEGIRSCAHGMKGSGGLYGFQKITEIGTLMEITAKTGNGEGVLQHVAELEWYLARVEVVYA